MRVPKGAAAAAAVALFFTRPVYRHLRTGASADRAHHSRLDTMWQSPSSPVRASISVRDSSSASAVNVGSSSKIEESEREGEQRCSIAATCWQVSSSPHRQISLLTWTSRRSLRAQNLLLYIGAIHPNTVCLYSVLFARVEWAEGLSRLRTRNRSYVRSDIIRVCRRLYVYAYVLERLRDFDAFWSKWRTATKVIFSLTETVLVHRRVTYLAESVCQIFQDSGQLEQQRRHFTQVRRSLVLWYFMVLWFSPFAQSLAWPSNAVVNRLQRSIFYLKSRICFIGRFRIKFICFSSRVVRQFWREEWYSFNSELSKNLLFTVSFGK